MKAYSETGKKITLSDTQEIKRGGEGKILSIPELPQQVAKIYLDSNYQHMSLAQKKALEVLDDKLFVKPLELIFAEKEKKNIIGFTMEYLSQDFLPLAAFFNKSFCDAQKVDIQWKQEVIQKILLGITAAHQSNIIIGDLSGFNILVDLQKNIKFIDTDSYETTVHTHWGVLFDEIRDYLYQGKVSQQSDYFAVAILSFQLFSYLHPFKGIHRQIKSMAERMLQKISVLSQDSNLIIPKCYQPIQNDYLKTQFFQIFNEGKRFLLNLQAKPLQVQKPQTLKLKVLPKTALKIKEVYQLNSSEWIEKADFQQNLGYIKTNQKLVLYDTQNHAYTSILQTFQGLEASHCFVTDKKFFILQHNRLLVWQSGQSFQLIQNIQLSATAQFKQVGNILLVLENNYMRFLHLNQVIQDQIYLTQTPVFVEGFDVFAGLLQNVGGIQYIFYQSGKNISTVKVDFGQKQVNLSQVKILGNVGIATYFEKENQENKLKRVYFSINGLDFKASQEFVEKIKSFAYQPSKGFIFEPSDDKMLIRKNDTFQVLQETEASFMSDDSQLFASNAGIIAQEKDFCYLLNS